MNLHGLVTVCFLVAGSARAASPSLTCQDGKAFLLVESWTRGCSPEPRPFYLWLHLDSNSAAGGLIDLKIGTELALPSHPNCDNPRGRRVTTHLPLPIESGEWIITYDGGPLGEVSFMTILPCRVRHYSVPLNAK